MNRILYLGTWERGASSATGHIEYGRFYVCFSGQDMYAEGFRVQAIKGRDGDAIDCEKFRYRHFTGG